MTSFVKIRDERLLLHVVVVSVGSNVFSDLGEILGALLDVRGDLGGIAMGPGAFDQDAARPT